MLTRLVLSNFRGFHHFEMAFGSASVLVGPNNAGKSTIISALRAAEQMLRHARARNPSLTAVDKEHRVWAYPISMEASGLDAESLHFNSRDEETRFDVSFRSGNSLHAVWPQGGEAAFFHLARRDHVPPRSAGEVRDHYPPIGVIPPLAPVERSETILDPATLRAGYSTRRASRHLRNYLYALTLPADQAGRTEFDAFRIFAAPWLPEIVLERPVLDFDRIALNYWEGLNLREISWVGDGIQVFIQFLYHCFRLRDVESIVIDEPDIYLHADLQRRLIRVLETVQPQYILATHAAEIAAEAPPKATVWVDRERTRAISAAQHPDIEGLVSLMGINFNLGLARVLRARSVVFAEGEDTKILRALAVTLDKRGLARETDVILVPIRGGANWQRLVSFDWLVDKLLGTKVKGIVVLDRDYKSDDLMTKIREHLRESNLDVHFWQRHEIENYLIVPSAIERLTGMPADEVTTCLAGLAAGMGDTATLDYMKCFTEDPTVSSRDPIRLANLALMSRDAWWKDPSTRLKRCPGKELLSGLNTELASRGYPTVTPIGLAKRLHRGEIDGEIRGLLDQIEG